MGGVSEPRVRRIDEVTIHEDDSVTSATCTRTHRPGEDAEE
jgi:hypothetical protein